MNNVKKLDMGKQIPPWLAIAVIVVIVAVVALLYYRSSQVPQTHYSNKAEAMREMNKFLQKMTGRKDVQFGGPPLKAPATH